MRRLFDTRFIFYCVVWLSIRLLRPLDFIPPIINSHLTDILAVPVIAHVGLTVTRRYLAKDNRYSYPLSYLLFIAAYTAFIFEWLMPQFSVTYTSDVVDIGCYFAGALFYYFVHMPDTKEKEH